MKTEETGRSDAHPSSDARLVILQRQNAELAEAVAARDTFIAVAAHELRNPMTPMLGQVELLLSGVQSGRYSPEQITVRLERVRGLLNHYINRAVVLLDVSRITSGKLRLSPAPCDLAVVLTAVVETFADAARHSGSRIDTDLPTSLPGTWDQLALEQIIDNLVSNAIKYGASQPIMARLTGSDGAVHLQVCDGGPGIPADNRIRIFERFERVVGTSDRHSGFGVGLWVVRQLVEAMGGTIAVEDAQDGGTIFNVFLPRHVAVSPS